MKKHLLTKLTVAVLMLLCVNKVDASILPGDLVVLGFNANGDDQIAILATRNIAANDVFKITDKGWLSSAEFRSGEGTLTWKGGAIPAGTIIYINLYTGYDSDGTKPFSKSGSFDLSASGDQLFIYQGSEASPVFIYGLNFKSNTWASTASDTGTSALPGSLVNGSTAVSLSNKNSYIYGEYHDISNRDNLLTELGNYNSWKGKAGNFDLATSFSAGSTTRLSPGDIMLIGYNDEGADEFVLVSLKAMNPGTQLKLTDRGWTSSGFYQNEGTLVYTVPASGLPAGGIIRYHSVATSSDFYQVGTNFELATAGDQLIIYQGSESSPNFLYGLNSRGNWATTANDAQSSIVPPISSTAGSATVLRTTTNGQGNFYYTGITAGSLSALQTSISSSLSYNYSGTSLSNIPAYNNFVITSLYPPLNLGLSADQNYILTLSPREPFTDASILGNQSVGTVNATVQYFDGLGRPLQTVSVKGNNDGTKDLVQPVEYDQFGREAKKFLPYASTSNNGSYKTDALTTNSGVFNFYNPSPSGNSGDQMGNGIVRNPFPFSETVFEPSPLNRVVQQGAPGDAWQPAGTSNTTDAGHTVKMEYGTNVANEVKLWTVTANGATGTTNYSANELYKTISKDENWNAADLKAGTTEEFKDKEGRVVLKRVWETDSKSLSTYYVYDDFGNLSYVLPPAVNENGQATLSSFTESDANFNSFIYGYHYDGRRRLTEKKIPGKGWEYMIYNKLDQVVLTQDALQRNAGQWLFTKYDALGRTVVSGLYNDFSGRSVLQTTVDQENPNSHPLWEQKISGGIGYSNDAFPRSIAYYHSINYYDDYDFPGAGTYPFAGKSNMTRGLPTGSMTTVLGSGNMLLSVVYYDDKGRALKTFSQHYLSGAVNIANYDEVTNEWNFDNSLKNTKREHHVGTNLTTIASRYEYDHLGRKLESYEKIFTAPASTATEVKLSSLAYNEIGQLKSKSLHNGQQTTQYTYNERGWLKSQDAPDMQYSELLKYTDGTVPQYNGNIANQQYTNGTVSNNSFSYGYDRLNRLLSATTSNGTMSEVLSYDVMGNINTLNREGTGANLYSYTGNQLQSVANVTPTAYVYDVNGNATTDGRNSKTLSYNYLNLPTSVNNGETVYTYDATGQKLKKQNNQTGVTTDYIGGIHYVNNSIAFIQTEEGRAVNSGGNYSYEYTLADHLGNSRVNFYFNTNSQQLQAIQRDDYYAFGKQYANSPGTNPYLYNGKEKQDELGGDYDYGARFYDPVIGRWNVPDPLGEFHFETNAYNYVLNNPINYIDPFGLDTIPVNKANIKTLDVKNDIISLDEVVVTTFANKNYSSTQDNTYNLPYRNFNGRATKDEGKFEKLKDINNLFAIGNEINPDKFKFSNRVGVGIDILEVLESENKSQAIDKVLSIAMERVAEKLIGSTILTTAITTTYNYQNNTPSQISKSALNFHKEVLEYRRMYRITGNKLFIRLESQAMKGYRNRVNRLNQVIYEK